MKVYINPTFDKPDVGDGGIRQVVTAQHKYLPKYGVEIVDNPDNADIVNCHATSIIDHPNLVLSCHGLYWSEDNWQHKWAEDANKLIIDGMRRASVVTVPSQWVGNVLSRGMLLDPVVVNHGVDINDWDIGTSAGYVLWNKNRHDPSCDSSVVNHLANLAQDIQFKTTYGKPADNVDVFGRIPHSEMKQYIANAAIYLATPRETFGVGIIEAMACGVPVLGWKWGGQAEIITHKVNGYLAEPGDYEDLLNGLYYCIQYRKSLGNEARQTVINKYQWDNVIQNYIVAYERALNKTYNKKVSVIITAYNLAEYLPAAIESVIDQSFDNWELIIVNDASTDNTSEIAHQYADTYNNILVIDNPENVHVSEARNIGIRAAQGEYIIPLDADDRLNTDALLMLSRSLDRDQSVSIATGAMQVFNTDGKSFVSGWPPPDPNYTNQIKKQNQLPYASMYRRSVWDRTGGYRRRIRTGVEDADFWTRALSFGFKALNIQNYPTLLYTMRDNSLSHTKKGENFLAWYTWANYPELAPFASHEAAKIYSLNPAVISVIIPVGPGHEVYLQDCLDSIISQTFRNWEVIVVNDTGESWYQDGKLTNQYLAGFPFVKVIDSNTTHGTSYARNTGINNASASLIAFMDCDDYAQPHWLESLYKVFKLVDGWIYTDWYADNGQEIYHDKAQDWNIEVLTKKAIGPISGLYKKEHLQMVGGFDERIGGWEDWDLHLSLLEHGICGTRIASPLFTYRYRTGLNRDKDFANRNDLVQYIVQKHKDIYEKGLAMGCSACGGATTVKSTTMGTVSKKTTPSEDLVTIKFIGPHVGVQHFKSLTHLGETYTVQQNVPFPVHRDEAYRFLDRNDYVLVPDEPVNTGEVSIQNTEPIVVHTTVAPSPVTVDRLEELPLEIKRILKKNNIKTVPQLRMLSDAALITMGGLGEKRIQKIHEVLNGIP